EHRLDVLAGAEGVGFEIGAGAGVVADVEAADVDFVLPLGLGVGDAEFGVDAVLAEVFNGELAGFRPLPAQVDLFFAEHSRPRGSGEDQTLTLAASVGCTLTRLPP